ncbi:hypothetical protein [Desulfosporosinus sp. Sb-LF]|uniref:hypothetical protein n=1 Tax=Desulfosporosinus sp. Sb-LF TaxID=2560027 RepID=UPI00107F38A0|nr:hypothetical protein [Desulfosporosinus sp. Sb-LF]TGE31807.1 hypothetical protein E4K68_15545 [Desulfosporosinus sp. Sb-LF]
MNKSSKMVSLFLSTALVLGTSGCTPTEQKVVYDKDGNPIVLQDNHSQGFFSGFFGPFGPLGPFGFFSGRGSGSGTVRNPGVSSGGSGVSGSSSNSDEVDGSGTTKSKSGITGVSPWGRSGSTSTSGGSSSAAGGTGITSGSHGGIGGGGSSAS